MAHWGILSVGQGISFGFVLLCLHFLEVECISRLGEEICREITLSDTAPHGRSEYWYFLTCRALLTPLSLAESVRGIVSPRGTRMQMGSSFLRAIEARRTAVS